MRSGLHIGQMLNKDSSCRLLQLSGFRIVALHNIFQALFLCSCPASPSIIPEHCHSCRTARKHLHFLCLALAVLPAWTECLQFLLFLFQLHFCHSMQSFPQAFLNLADRWPHLPFACRFLSFLRRIPILLRAEACIRQPASCMCRDQGLLYLLNPWEPDFCKCNMVFFHSIRSRHCTIQRHRTSWFLLQGEICSLSVHHRFFHCCLPALDSWKRSLIFLPEFLLNTTNCR